MLHLDCTGCCKALCETISSDRIHKHVALIAETSAFRSLRVLQRGGVLAQQQQQLQFAVGLLGAPVGPRLCRAAHSCT